MVGQLISSGRTIHGLFDKYLLSFRVISDISFLLALIIIRSRFVSAPNFNYLYMTMYLTELYHGRIQDNLVSARFHPWLQ
jgi:hypothetical protein